MSDRALTYTVSVAGQAQFARDMQGILGLVRRAATEQVAIESLTAKNTRRIRDDGARHTASLLKTNLALEKARAKESEREYARAEKAKTRVAQTEDKSRQRAAQSEARVSLRAKVEETRAFERAEREKTRIALREARARQREEESIQRSTMRAQEATSRHIMREREKMQRQAEREAHVAQRDALFDRKRFFRGIGGGAADGAYNAIGSVYNLASRGVRSIASGMGADRAFDVQDIVAERMEVQRMMRSVSIEARVAGGASGGFDEVAAANKIRATSLKYGISQRDLAGAIDVYSEKGSGKTAVENIDRIASQANAMGTSASVVAKLRAQLGLSSKNAGKELGEDEKDALIAKMHFSGKTGVFRAEDIAEESEELFSQFAKNGGNFTKDFTSYLAFASEARSATGGKEKARTVINSVQDAIAKKEGKINALGIKTRDKEGHERFFVDVVKDVIAKTGGTGETINKIFDPSKSGKAISTMVSTFKGAGGGKSGIAAMDKLLEGDASLKAATPAEMAKDAAARMDQPAARVARAVETIRQSIGEKLAPVLERLAANAPKIAEAITKVLDLVTKNPEKALGAYVAAKAGIGAAKPIGSAALRFVGDTLAALGGAKGGVAGKVLGGVGGMITQSGAQPVYITGAAPGVMGGGGLGGGGGMPLGGAGLAGIGAGTALAGAGLAIAVTYLISKKLENPNAFEDPEHTGHTNNPDERKEVLAGRSKEREQFADGVESILTGKPEQAKIDAAHETLAKFYPEIAKKVQAGEMSTTEAGTEVTQDYLASKDKKKTLNFETAADGTVQIKQTKEANFDKIIESLELIAVSAGKAGKAMEAITPPNVSMLHVYSSR